MHRFWLLLLTLLLVVPADALAQHPPHEDAQLPRGLWESVRRQGNAIEHGDPAWSRRMQQRRHALRNVAAGKQSTPLATDRFVLPVLLGSYDDQAGTETQAAFQQHLFGDNPTGNLTEYYDEVSYGQFELTGTVYGWFEADSSGAYYSDGNNGMGSFPRSAKGFVRSVVEDADPNVDFSKYDNDGPDGVPSSGDDDGYVDAVMVVFPGGGADWATSNTLWPHMSSLGNDAYMTNDGVTVSTYAVCPELSRQGGEGSTIRSIGVYVHEFGHVLGLPDLYDRVGDAGDDSEGLGEWGLMANGSWGGDGRHPERPSHMTAWSKIQMGWLPPTILTEDAPGLSIRSATSNPEAFLLWEDGYEGTRYFLLENRQQTGFDEYLNGSGLLVYHVDENQRFGRARWSSGSVNDDETHKLVDLEEADGLANLDNNQNRGDDGDPFPGTSGNTSFTDATTPSALDYDGAATGVAVTNISSSAATMTADVQVRHSLGYYLAYDENGISGWGWGSENAQPDSWGGVRFNPSESGTLAAVDVGFRAGGTSYEVAVFDDFGNNQTGTPLVSVSGSTSVAGWHTIALPEDQPVTVTAGQDVLVAVNVKDQAYAISYDRWGISESRSYYSSDGQSWSGSIGTSEVGGDINLRARVRTTATNVAAEEGVAAPRRFALLPGHPNPSRGRVMIPFEVPHPAPLTLRVFDLLGREVATLADDTYAAGSHLVTWDAERLASGLYVCRLEAGDFSATRRLVLLD